MQKRGGGGVTGVAAPDLATVNSVPNLCDRRASNLSVKRLERVKGIEPSS